MREAAYEEEFVGLISSNQIRLRAFLVAMVRNAADVDDLIQETNLALWRKRDQYQPERSFASWACGVAYLEVASFRRKNERDRLWFDHALLEKLAGEFVDRIELHDLRQEALGECIKRLPDADKRLVEGRFRLGKSVEELGAEFGRPQKTIYWLLSMVKKKLHTCIEKQLRQQAHPG